MEVQVEGFDKPHTFIKAKDGWWECEEIARAINPKETVCKVSPWYVDFVDAPSCDFTIIDTDCDNCDGTGAIDTPFSGSEPCCEICSGTGLIENLH